MGLGLAVAVLIDATVIRGVMLPAAMKLLGDWNWYLPSWLEWLPHIGGEGDMPDGPPEPIDVEEPQPAPVPLRARYPARTAPSWLSRQSSSSW